MNSDTRLTAIGNESPTCPYCSRNVKKVVGYRDCPHCGEYIHSCRRPSDEKYVLLTSQQRLEVDEQWAIKKGRHEEWLGERLKFEAEASRLFERTGNYPQDWQVDLSLAEKSAIEALGECELGVYRNWLYQVSKIYEEGKEVRNAVKYLSMVLYIDACGPMNSGGRGRKRFDSKLATYGIGPAGRLGFIAYRCFRQFDEIEPFFLEHVSEFKELLGARVFPTTAWKKNRSVIQRSWNDAKNFV